MKRLEKVVDDHCIIRDSDGYVTIQRNGSSEAIQLIPQVGEGKLVWFQTLYCGESCEGGMIASRKALQAALEMLPK